MRKHPLIALIVFAFLAISVFVGAGWRRQHQLDPRSSHLSPHRRRLVMHRRRVPAVFVGSRCEKPPRAAAAAIAAQIVNEHSANYWQATCR